MNDVELEFLYCQHYARIWATIRVIEGVSASIFRGIIIGVSLALVMSGDLIIGTAILIVAITAITFSSKFAMQQAQDNIETMLDRQRQSLIKLCDRFIEECKKNEEK